MHHRRYLVLLLLAVAASMAMAPQDWPMWGGTAQRNMVSAMKGLADTWDAKAGTNIKWEGPTWHLVERQSGGGRRQDLPRHEQRQHRRTRR